MGPTTATRGLPPRGKMPLFSAASANGSPPHDNLPGGLIFANQCHFHRHTGFQTGRDGIFSVSTRPTISSTFAMEIRPRSTASARWRAQSSFRQLNIKPGVKGQRGGFGRIMRDPVMLMQQADAAIVRQRSVKAHCSRRTVVSRSGHCAPADCRYRGRQASPTRHWPASPPFQTAAGRYHSVR